MSGKTQRTKATHGKLKHLERVGYRGTDPGGPQKKRTANRKVRKEMAKYGTRTAKYKD